jgi:hypothetical protein
MKDLNELLPQEDEKYSQEVCQDLEDYITYKEQEGLTSKMIAADQFPEELKEVLHLDIFPEDIQNDILLLSQKIVDFALKQVEKSDQEAIYGQQSTLYKMSQCSKQIPWRDIGKDAWRGGAAAGKYSTFLPGPMGRAAKPIMRPAGFIATGLAGIAGSYAGCLMRGHR